MKTGRPTKYKPMFCEMLIEHMTKGYSFESFAAIVKVDREQLYKWRDKHDEFHNAIKKAKEEALLTMEKLGHAIASGQVSGGGTGAWIFLMKNKHSWTDKTEITGKADKPLVLKYALDEDPDSLNANASTDIEDQSKEGE